MNKEHLDSRVGPSVPCVEPTGSTAEQLPGAVTAAKLTHTPGPWRVSDECDSVRLCCVMKENYYIATLQWFVHEGTTEGNARLIAAAPDLLAALRELYDMSHAGHYDAMVETEEEVAAIFARARAAIAKAEQES